jgi:hypothetical protein
VMSLLQQYIYSYPSIYQPVNFKMTFVYFLLEGGPTVT